MSISGYEQALARVSESVGGPIVAFDTATASGSLCVVGLRDGDIIERELPLDARPSEALLVELERALSHHERRAADVKAWVVGLGPGSFTGIRVALATAKGLARATGAPLLGISSLALLAAPHSGRTAVVLDARQGEWFSVVYDVEPGRVHLVGEAQARRVEELAHLLEATRPDVVVSDSLPAGLRSKHSRVEPPTMRAGFGLWLLRERIERGDGDDPIALAPVYLRASAPERKLEARS